MIPLRFRAELPPIEEPLVVRLRDWLTGGFRSDREAVLLGIADGGREYDFNGFSLRIEADPDQSLDGDVVMGFPGSSVVHRLVRAGSSHNTFLITERCDQLCVMCSQPPKQAHRDLFPQFEQAALLAPIDATIGLSGGEPLLFKEQLFALIDNVSKVRPDLRFHVLTNAQHFDSDDEAWLRGSARERILWGIPLYAPGAADHDAIVVKEGAFTRLFGSLAILARAGAMIELRTVVTRRNAALLPRLARLIATDLPFCASWALMQLEPIGYGRMNWNVLFHDSSVEFEPIARAMNIALALDIDVALYNFPLCTVPEEYRHYAPRTISDWKQKYLETCRQCSLKPSCGGFFEWYDPKRGFARVSLT